MKRLLLILCALCLAPGAPLGAQPSAAPVACGTEPAALIQGKRRRKPQKAAKKPVKKPASGAQKRAQPKAKKPAQGQRGKPGPKKGAKKARGKAASRPPQGASATGTGTGPPAANSRPGPADPVEESLSALERKALSSQATASDFLGLSKQLERITTGEGARGALANRRLQRTINDLERRSRASALSSADMAILREQWLDTRIDRALERLVEAAAGRDLQKTDFGPVSALLQQRATAAKPLDAQAGSARLALQTKVDKLSQLAASRRLTASDFAELRASLTLARLARALSDLEARSLAKSASLADLERLDDLLTDHGASPKVDPKLYEKLRQAVARLESRALRGEVTRDEFLELREGLTLRARSAVE